MNDEEKRNIALFRYGIIAPLISGTYDESKVEKSFFVMLQKELIQIQGGMM